MLICLRWLGIIVICFGAFCAGIAGSKNFSTLTTLRFFLGAAEAGVFPGMIFYLSFWYKPEERATRIAGFLCSATLAGAFGGGKSTGLILGSNLANSSTHSDCLRSGTYEWRWWPSSMAMAIYL
jgi:MFS family permease